MEANKKEQPGVCLREELEERVSSLAHDLFAKMQLSSDEILETQSVQCVVFNTMSKNFGVCYNGCDQWLDI